MEDDTGLSWLFVAPFLALVPLALGLAVYGLRREGWRGMVASMTGRGSYRPRVPVLIGMGIIVLSWSTVSWIAYGVIGVILFMWWQQWRVWQRR